MLIFVYVCTFWSKIKRQEQTIPPVVYENVCFLKLLLVHDAENKENFLLIL